MLLDTVEIALQFYVNLNTSGENMDKRAYLENADEIMAKITKGAFLTVKAGDEVNTMTIGWATIGFIWQRQVFSYNFV